jgi:preprotein translocase subunit SecA
VEYQREGFDMFNSMMEAIKEESVGFLFNVEVKNDAAAAAPPPAAPADLVATGPGENPGEVLVEHLSGQDEVAPAAAVPPPAPERPAPSPAAPTPPPAVLPEAFGRPERPAQVQYSGPTFDSAPGSTGVQTSSGPASSAVAGQGPGPGGGAPAAQSRNELCACGSGRKYKRCHGAQR